MSPLISKSTSAARRFSETWPAFSVRSGERICWTTGLPASVRSVSSTAARKAGSSIVDRSLSMRTLSLAGCLNPASRSLFTRPDSPGPEVFWSIVWSPADWPIRKAIATKASQPKVAVFQCAALQRPMRAATFLDRRGCGGPASGDI